MKKLAILIFLLSLGCTTTKQISYKVFSENYNTRERTMMETIDINDVLYLYESITGFKLDTTKINPFYDERTAKYYFYVERKERK